MFLPPALHKQRIVLQTCSRMFVLWLIHEIHGLLPSAVNALRLLYSLMKRSVRLELFCPRHGNRPSTNAQFLLVKFQSVSDPEI